MSDDFSGQYLNRWEARRAYHSEPAQLLRDSKPEVEVEDEMIQLPQGLIAPQEPSFFEKAQQYWEDPAEGGLVSIAKEIVDAGGRLAQDMERIIHGPLPDDPYPMGRSDEEILGDMTIIAPTGSFAASAAAKPAVKQGEKLLGSMAWHGSPHKFEKVDLSKVGTGEGAQAYGWGFYSAESSDVAKSYVPRDFDQEEKLLAMYNKAYDAGDYESAEVLERAMMHETPEEIRDTFTVAAGYSDDFVAKANKIADEVAEMGSETGHLYKLDVDDEAIKTMMDWEMPLEDSPLALEQLKDLPLNIKPEQSGAAAYRKIGKAFEDGGSWAMREAEKLGYDPFSAEFGAQDAKKLASEYLLSKGIRGIKYLDQNSRGTGKGTRNYVAFAEEDIVLLERDSKKIAQPPKTKPKTEDEQLEVLYKLEADNPDKYNAAIERIKGRGEEVTTSGLYDEAFPQIERKRDAKGRFVKESK